nr:myosin heavy chain, striated muscle-like [Aegilops tauschii subsp. strangulata]
MREDVVARERRLADHKASLDAKEQEMSLREENLEATLHAKDESLEALVQQRTKELKDEHGAALDTLSNDHAAQLKKLVDDLDAASSAKAELERQVAKLNEDLAGSAKEVEALKEEARQAELHLADVQSQLSSKTQSLEAANSNISDMTARIGSLEQSAESLESQQQQLSKELENAKRLRQDAEDKVKNQVDMSNLWIKSLVDVAERLGAQAVVMGMDGPVYSASEQEVPSVKLGIFFNDLIDKLKVQEEGRGRRFATESRRLARNALFMVLSNIACRHPELDLDDGFRKPPVGADVAAAEHKAAPRADRVLRV